MENTDGLQVMCLSGGIWTWLNHTYGDSYIANEGYILWLDRIERGIIIKKEVEFAHI